MSLHCDIRPAQLDDRPAIIALADQIWRAHYPDMISVEQIDYMLAQRYHPEALREQITGPDQWFDLVFVEGELSGFAQYLLKEPGEMKLDKLYLLPSLHGKGYGSRLIHHVKKKAREQGCERLVLSVNKQNQKAIDAYLRNGFRIRESIVVDIGGGFVMDDYVMEKDL
ncbi:GNAT family N-acetyltransferase [Chitinimonas lacunae]|uniref:GNAT family N-acetyltransferase n=1 Tax=Chitinimonas lacunae TaxID=1963018 RepID=A0ABV8MQP0_9NEIS